MSKSLSRRMFVRTSAGVVGVGAVGALVGGVANADPAPVRAANGGVARVLSHRLGVVQLVFEKDRSNQSVNARITGFPDGWQLDANDLVFVPGPDDPYAGIAQPLVNRVEGTMAGQPRDGDTTVRVNGTAVRLRQETDRDWRSAVDGSAGETVEAYYIPNTDGRVPSCVAIRRI